MAGAFVEEVAAVMEQGLRGRIDYRMH
jgi:hypothetical protein